MIDNVLEITGLCKDYDEFSLKNVSFSLPKGRIMGFVGQNGAGKTTTIKSVLGMLRPSSGEIKILGGALDQVKERVGVVMDSPYYASEWTVTSLEKAVSPFYSNWSAESFHKALKNFSVSTTKKISDLSRGMKVKLMMAVALSHGAELLILDEPTSGLDPVARDELIEILADLRKSGKSVLFSTHITSDLERVADYVTFIKNGEIIYSGDKKTLLQSYKAVKIKDITEELKALVIGGREFDGVFEGMAPAESAGPFGAAAVSPTLEEIVVYMSREDRNYE
ncbi:MAG: ABC transporter ATP-binding protein [Clostridiales bacterium]|nr:ABC transporter ATP-binding protein [Clostridiales bacterium]